MCWRDNMDIPVPAALFLVIVGFLNYACGQGIGVGVMPLDTSGGPGSDVISWEGQTGVSGIAVDMTNNIPPPFTIEGGGSLAPQTVPLQTIFVETGTTLTQQPTSALPGQSEAVEARLDLKPSVDFMTAFLNTGLNNIARSQGSGMGGFRVGPSAGSFGQLQNTDTNGQKQQSLNQQEWQSLMDNASKRQQALLTKVSGGTPKVNETPSQTGSLAGNINFEVDPSQITQDKIAKNVVSTSDVQPLDQFSTTLNQGQDIPRGPMQDAGGKSINLDVFAQDQTMNGGMGAGAAAQTSQDKDALKSRLRLKMAKLFLKKARQILEAVGVDQGTIAQLIGLETVTDQLSNQITTTNTGSSTTAVETGSMATTADQTFIGSGPVVGPVVPSGPVDQPEPRATQLPWLTGLPLTRENVGLSETGQPDLSAGQTWQPSVPQPPGQGTAQYECTSIPDDTNRSYYYQILGSTKVRRRCALGTEFDVASCECSNIVNPKGNCLEVQMDFNNGRVEDISPNQLPIGNEKVEVTNGSSAYPGIAVFVGDGKLTVWRYQNYDFRDHIMLKLQFRPGMGGDRRQSLISNCDGGAEEPSVGIVYDAYTSELELLLRPFNETKSVLMFTVDPNTWTDVTYKYDGQLFSGTVNGVTKSKPVDGNVDITDAALVLGYCGVYGYYTGAMDDVSIYRCIP